MALLFDEQLSLLQKPNKDEMTQEEFAIFEKTVDTMMTNQGFINNLFKVLPLNAKQYIGFLNFKNSLFDPETTYLSFMDKEMIGVVVSSYNCCSYCLTTHGDALRGLSGDPEWADRVSYNYRSARLTPKQRALCDFAWYLTAHVQEIDVDQVEKLRAVGFNDHEILEAAYVSGFFNYTNRWVSTIKPLANSGHFSHNR